jgi:hypothetical protein
MRRKTSRSAFFGMRMGFGGDIWAIKGMSA